jgi:hypothetical protein
MRSSRGSSESGRGHGGRRGARAGGRTGGRARGVAGRPCRARRCRGARRSAGDAEAEAGGPQAAQRLVERGDVAELRVVGEQRQHVVVRRAEHLLDEAVQGLLGPDLDEHAGAGLVQGVQALDELHRLGDLPAQDLQHRLGVRVGGVELAGHVGHDRQLGPAHLQAAQRHLQAARSPRDDLVWKACETGMRMAVMPAAWNRCDGRLDRGGRPADDRLGVGVDVGHHDVAVDLADDPLDVGQRAEHGGHRPVVLLGDRWAISRPRALTASRAASKLSAPAATSAPYSPRLWPMTRSGVMP